jgi:rhodanese-related sulfurtransferase
MAVAIKNLGYNNIKIYNGGIKDWKKSGYKLNVIELLPDYKGKFITADELLELIKKADSNNCTCTEDECLVKIVDLRTEHSIKSSKPLRKIKTKCQTLIGLLDDLRNPELRGLIPRKGIVVTVTETGNRDIFAMRYLYNHGYTNVRGLRFGMRSWIKLDYPMESSQK